MKRSPAVYLFLLLSATYVLLVMLFPTDPETLKRFSISQVDARLLNLTIVVPLVIIWYLALNGFIRLREYSRIIRDSNEGWAFTLLSTGLMVLAFGLPVNSIISALFNYISIHNPGFVPTGTILKNYVMLAISLTAFLLLARGATQLVVSHKRGDTFRPIMPIFIAPLMVVVSCIYTWLVVAGPERNTNNSGYYLPNWLIIFTLVIPYITAWMGGILTLYYLNIYKNKVRGPLYKQAFSQLAKGIGVVTLISVLLQFLTTIAGQINRLRLTPILFLIYFLVILYAVGFWYIAHGTKKLQKFEEV